jgi:hemolysin activation/secretion protein
MCKKNKHQSGTVILTMLLLGHIGLSMAAETVDATANTSATASQSAPQAESEAVSATQGDSLPEQASVKDTNYFDIFEFQVEGNTKLSKPQIETAVYPHMGEKKTIADVNKARDALEKAYHAAGFLTVLVDIPEQDVDNKIVKLNVTEGKVGRLRVKDSRYFSLGRIKELAPSVQEGVVPNFPELQKDLAKLNRTADKRVTPVMKAGKVFGTVDVDLKVEDNLPVHASLELNDRYSQDTTRLRLGGMIRYDNLWQREHSLSLNFLTSPENFSEVKVVSANYLMRFDESDILLALYGVRSKSNVASVGGINILGDGTILGVRLIKPLPSIDNYYHSISFGLDYKDFGQTVVFGSSFDTPITYMPLSASYTGTWQQESSTTQLTTGINFGLRGLVSDQTEFTNKKGGAKPNFFIAKAELQRTQALPLNLQGFAQIDGQFSGAPLISNEQYLAGGADTVRGYLEAQASGDQALHSTLELRSPPLFKSATWLQDFKLSAFYDIAQLTTLTTSGPNEKSILSGTGIGVRMKALKNFNVNLDLAWPLKDYGITKSGDLTSHMRVWYEF